MSDQPISPVEDSEIDLLHVFAVIWRRKWLIAGGSLIVLVVAWLVCINLPKAYQVTVKIWPVHTPATGGELTSGGSNRVDMEAVVKPIVAFFQNYSLAESAIREFELDKSPFDLTASAFLEGNVDVQLDRKTNLIHFSLELTDAAMAWEVVNYMAREGIERYSQLVQKKFTQNADYLASQLDESRMQLKKEGEALTAFQQKANTRSLTGRKYFLQSQSDELAGMIVEAEIELAAKERGNSRAGGCPRGKQSGPGIKCVSWWRKNKQGGIPFLQMTVLVLCVCFQKSLNDFFENSEARLIRNKAEYASLQAGKEKMAQTKRDSDAELALIEEQLASVSVEEEKATY